MLAFDEDGNEVSLAAPAAPKAEKPSRVTQTVNEDLEPEKRALLDTIAGGEAPGYDAMYTGKGGIRRFNDFSDHPRSGDRITSGPNLGKVSRAAGRYQFTPATWDQQAKKLGLPNFRPEHQDRAAADLAESTYGKHMLDALRTGDPQRIASVGRGLNTQWTSLPGGPESSMRDDDFVRRYQQNLSKYKASSQSQESIPKIGFTDDEVEAIEPVAVPETAPTPAPQAAATPEWSDYAKQYAAGVADIPKTIAAGADLLGADKFANYLREGAKSYEEDWRNQMTPAGREAADKPLLDENNNIQNLRAIPMAAASSIPGMIAMGGAGKAVGSGLKFLGTTEKLAPLIEKIPGINPEVAKKVADWTANGIAYGGAEGVYSGLSNAEQKRDEIINTPLETLAKNPTFQEALRSEPKTGSSIDRAKRVREKLASLAMEDTFLKTAASTGVIGALTGGGIFGQLESRIGKTAAGQIALDTLLESGQEALQSGGESIIGNKVTQKYGDPNRGTFEGTVNDIATGAATGGLLGGVGGAGGVLGGRNEQPISQPSVSGETNGQDANVSNPGNEGREGIPSETQTGRPGGEGRVQGEQESTAPVSPTNATSETQQAPVKVGEKPAAKGYTMLPSPEGIQIVDGDGNVVSTHPQITDAIEAFDQLHADNTQAQTPTDQETSNELQTTTAPSGQVGQLQDQASRGQQASEGAEQGSRQEAVKEGHHGLNLPAQGQVNLGDQTSGQIPEGTTNADRPTGNAGENVSGSATSLQSAAGGEQGAGVPPGGNRRGSRSGGAAADVQVSPTEAGSVPSDRVTSRPLTAKEEGELRGHNTVLKKLGKPAMTPEQYLAEQSAKLQTAASNRNVTDQEVVDAYNSAVGRHNQRAVEENRRIDAAGTGESKKILRSNVRAAATLPSSGSLQRRTAESIAKIFGHKIIYVESADGKPLDIDGSIVGSHPNHILLAADSKQSLSRVAIHEMVHGLRRNSPEIYGQLVRNLREHYNPLAVAKHLEDRGYDSELPSFSDNPEVFSDENRSEEEWVSDHVSDIIHHPESIQQLAERMEGQKTGSGRAFLNHVKDFIDSLISKLRGEGFGTESAVARKHLKKSREAVVEALAKYHAHQQGGVSTRAGEEIVDSKRSATSQEQVKQAEFPDEIRTTAGLDNALKIAKGQVWRKGRDLKQTIQDAVMKIAGKSGVKPNEFNSEETFDYLKKVAKDDVLFALKQNPNAVGWYDEKTHQALALMALVHPEIKKNQDARFAFVWALAVTSNGMKVDKNFELAEKAYEVYKKTGHMPTNIRAGQAQKAINQSLKLFNDLRDQWGMDDLRRFMLTDFKVSEIAGIDSALKPGGEHVDVTVKGASILGPKIGNGFFSNLYGNFDSLTMDRWLIRTWGRWTGTLIAPMPEQTANARSRLSQVLKSAVNDSHVQRVFEEAVGHPLTQGADVDTLAGEIQKASMDPDFRNELSKTEIGNELRKAGNGLAKYLDGQKEAPYGPQERKDIRKVFQSVLDELNETEEYKDLTMADMQAVLWYAEKRLYESAKEDFADDSDETEGYTDDEAPDYANAAAAIARSKGISDKKIKATLKRESNDGRSRTTRSRNAEEGLQQTQVGQQEEARGFTSSEKRTFLRTRAVHRIRSNRVSDGEQSWSYERKSRRIGGKPGVLKNLGVTAEADWRLKQKSKNALKNSGSVSFSPFLELVQGDPANAQKFADYITSFKQSIGKDGAAVYAYPAEDYGNMRLFLAEDGKAGFALKPDGDIVSVFGRGQGDQIMLLATQLGGKKLDAFDTMLGELYGRHGFVAVSRIHWNDEYAPENWDKQSFASWNGGEPDVILMAYDPTYSGKYRKTDGKYYTDFDQAAAAQRRAILAVRRGKPLTKGNPLSSSEKTKEESDDVVFSNRSNVPTPVKMRARQALIALSKFDGFFQTPRSSAKSMQDIAADINPEIEVKTSRDGQHWTIIMEDGSKANVNTDHDGKIYVDASGLEAGKSRGSELYSIIGAFAYNNGLVFKGDPDGLSKMAMIRRTEQMLSSALKYGTTRHLEPHPLQNIDWIESDDLGNLDRLIEKSYLNAVEGNAEAGYAPIKELEDIQFNFNTRRFERIDSGEAFTNEDFDRLSGLAKSRLEKSTSNSPGGARPSAPGRTTLKRAALLASLLRKTRGGSAGIGRGSRGTPVLVEPAGISGPGGLDSLPDDLAGVVYSNRAPDRTPNPPFYSQLARGFESSKMDSMPGSQWRAWLFSNKAKLGIKDDEIAWTGIEDFLRLKGKEKVTKADIASFLKDNGVQVSEVVKGDINPEWNEIEPGIFESGEYLISRLSENKYWLINPAKNKFDFSSFDDAKAEAEKQMRKYGETKNPTKYSSYTLPGGSNYRELLITLPQKSERDLANERMQAFTDKLTKRIGHSGWDFSSMTPEEIDEYDRLNEATLKASSSKEGRYRSSHWDEANVLAHIRVNDREDADGSKVLFVQEIQSDWGQEGRKKGFKGEKVKGYEVSWEGRPIMVYETKEEAEAHVSRALKSDPGAPISIKEVMAQKNVQQESGKIDTAPFVKDTKAWVSLALKRVIRMAAEGGYDKVAFVNGEQSADLYDLSKQVDSIVVPMVNEDGSRSVRIDSSSGQFRMMVDKNGNVEGHGAHSEQFSGKTLDEVVGKEIADKIMSVQPYKKTPGKAIQVEDGTWKVEWADGTFSGGYDQENAERRSREGKQEGSFILEGEGLKVGGEGMKSFYDQIVPQVANEVLKKVGGGRVAPTEMKDDGHTFEEMTRWNGPDWSIDQVKEMYDLSRKSGPGIHENPLTGKREAFQINRVSNTNGIRRLLVNMNDGASFAEAIVDPDISLNVTDLFGGEHQSVPESERPKRTMSQPGFDVTPAMRDKALDGMPLFSNRKNILGETPLATWTAPKSTPIDNIIYTMQDKLVDTKRVQEAITSAQRLIADEWNPYQKELLYHGRTTKQTDDFLSQEIRPLFTAMEEKGISMDELEEYLHNRHAEERNEQIAKINPGMSDGGSGIKTQDARDYLRMLPPEKAEKLEELAAQVDAISKGTRDLLVKTGLETQATVDAWQGAYKHYVPLQREELEVSPKGQGTGQGMSIRGSSSKRATGSTRKVVDILANLMMQRERAIVRSEKNKVATALYGLAIQNENSSFWLPVNPDAIKNPDQVVQDLLNMGLDQADIDGIMAEPTETVVDSQTGLVVHRINPRLRTMDNVLATRINGKDRFLFFSKEDERAVRMVAALKNLDEDRLGTILTNFRKVTRWMSAINTQYNPIFGIVNLARDVQGGMLNLTSTPLAGKQLAVLSNVGPALKGIYSDLRADRKGKPRSSNAWSTLWEEYQGAGGRTGYRDAYKDSADRAEALRKEIKRIQEGTLKRFGRGIFDWLSDYNDTLENAIRLSAYKVAKDNGISKDQAAALAKNLTVNFNKKGQIASQAGSLYAFFNAGIQGNFRLAQTLSGSAGKKIMAGGLILGSAQAILLAAAGYDDDEPPEFTRERNLIIPVGGSKYVTIPLPLGFHVIPNTSRILTELVLNKGKDSGDKLISLLASYADAFDPMGFSGFSYQTLSPTATDPLVALAENRNAFGRAIAKEDRSSLDPSPGFTRMKDTATGFSKIAAYVINRMSGGTDYKAGAASPTPDQIDFLIGQATGGVGREVQKTAQFVSSTISGEDIPPHKIPLAGRFYGDTKSQSSETARFYKNLKELNAHEREIKGRIKDGKDVKAYEAEHPEAAMVSAANAVEKMLTNLKTRKRIMIAKGASRSEVKALEGEIASRIKKFNDDVKARSQK